MLRSLLVGLPAILACLVLQSYFVTLCLRSYLHFRQRSHDNKARSDMLMLSSVMLITLVGNFVQMGFWALLFLFLGEFDTFHVALYHSGVNFATLGYGDIVMSEQWRLLGPLEAANGILMFGVSTAVMTAAVMDVMKHNSVAREAREASKRPPP
jgi:hypothetical protein